MKYLPLLLLLLACEQDHYNARFDATATTVLPANLSTETIQLSEGGIVYGAARFYNNETRVELERESDLEVSSTSQTVARVLRGPDQNSFIFIGVSAGDAGIEIRYRGRVVQTRSVSVQP